MGKRTRSKRASRGCPLSTPPCCIPEPLAEMAARLLLLAVLVCDCSALLLGASPLRHFVARDTVTRRGATVQMDLSSLVSDHPLAAIAVTAAVSSAAGTALGVFVLPTRAPPAATLSPDQDEYESIFWTTDRPPDPSYPWPVRAIPYPWRR